MSPTVEIKANVRENVEKGAELFTDDLPSYKHLSPDFVHQFVNHAETYVQGKVHTNGMENFWSLLKRGIKGTYVRVEPFHLSRYLDEQVFRFNERKDCDAARFVKAARGIVGKGIRYMWGVVTYEDAFGESRRHAFCQLITWMGPNNFLATFIPGHGIA